MVQSNRDNNLWPNFLALLSVMIPTGLKYNSLHFRSVWHWFKWMADLGVAGFCRWNRQIFFICLILYISFPIHIFRCPFPRPFCPSYTFLLMCTFFVSVLFDFQTTAHLILLCFGIFMLRFSSLWVKVYNTMSNTNGLYFLSLACH